MSDPFSKQEPFQPEATPVRGGCGKAAVFGCGGLLIVMLIAGIVLVVKYKEITSWGFGMMEKQVMARLPAETTDEEARRIRQGFAAVIEAVQEDRADPTALEQLQPLILRFADPNKTPRQEDVDRLTELLEAASGIEGLPGATPSRPAMPEPVPEPTG